MSSIYSKYRPQLFSEISGQSHIIRTLSNAIKNNRIGHAYLFTGPRGTGKTTLARIFSQTINCLDPQKKKQDDFSLVESCLKCANCQIINSKKALDIIEIDAASYTGVDNIRQIRETVPLPPSKLKYKVYIIDEVHMLSQGAFNALLKTLEEPPSHAIFILATTEVHKVPVTIISRCQRFDFLSLTQEQIISRLEKIAKKENVEIEKAALETIAIEAEGGMRDAESLLGQIIGLEDQKITATEVDSILGTSPRKKSIDFLNTIFEKKYDIALQKISELSQEGVNFKNFTKNIINFLRAILVLSISPDAKKHPSLKSLTPEQINLGKEIVGKYSAQEILNFLRIFLESLQEIKDAFIPQLPLEMAVIKIKIIQSEKEPPKQNKKNIANFSPSDKGSISPTNPQEKSPSGYFSQNQDQESVHKKNNEDYSQNNPSQPSSSKIDSSNNETKNAPLETKKEVCLEEIIEKWSEILEKLKPLNHSIYGFLSNCSLGEMTKEGLYIKVRYSFHKKTLSNPKNLLTIQNVIANIIQCPIKVFFVSEEEFQKIKTSQKSDPSRVEKNIVFEAMRTIGGRIIKKNS